MTQILVKEDARLELEKLHVMLKEKIVATANCEVADGCS